MNEGAFSFQAIMKAIWNPSFWLHLELEAVTWQPTHTYEALTESDVVGTRNIRLLEEAHLVHNNWSHLVTNNCSAHC